MSATLWLRISSVISFLFATGHTLGGREYWSPIGQSDVLTAMRTFRFDVEGVSRTYLDFYRGFGYSLSIFLVAQAVILWQLSSMAANHPDLARGPVATITIATLVGTVITWMFIFPLPTVFSAVLTLTLGVAWAALR